MPVRVLEPIAEGDLTDWTLGAGASKVAAVLLPDDDAATYITRTGPGSETLYVEQLLGATAVNDVVVHGRTRLVTVGGVGTVVIDGGARLGGTNSEELLDSASSVWSYCDATTASVARPGGGNWEIDDFPGGGSGAQLLVSNAGFGSTVFDVTTLHFLVDYAAASSGFVSLLLSLGGLLGGGIGLEHMAAIAAAVRARTRALIKPSEYREALAELRAWRRPAYFPLEPRRANTARWRAWTRRAYSSAS